MNKFISLLVILISFLACNQPEVSTSEDSNLLDSNYYEDESSAAFEGEVYSDSLDNYTTSLHVK